MEARRKQESDAHIPDCPAKPLDWHLDVDSKRLHNVGTPAAACHGTIAVLRHAYPGAGNHERRRSRNIKRAGSITTGPARVEHGQNLTIPQWFRLLAHHPCKTNQ